MRVISKVCRPSDGSLTVVLLVAASRPSISGRVMGHFTLPVPAEWGCRGLLAGEYRFVVSIATFQSWVYVQGDDDVAVVFAASMETASGTPMSELRLVYDGNGYRVRHLKLRDAGRVLYFEPCGLDRFPPKTLRWVGIPPIIPMDVRRKPHRNRSGNSSVKKGNPGVFAMVPSRPGPSLSEKRRTQ